MQLPDGFLWRLMAQILRRPARSNKVKYFLPFSIKSLRMERGQGVGYQDQDQVYLTAIQKQGQECSLVHLCGVEILQ